MPKVPEAYIEERRQQILDAAVACFGRKGFHQTTMDDIGREAGLSHGVAYRYFDSKEDIILATTRESSDERTLMLLEEALSQSEDLFHLLDTALRYWFARFERPGTAGMMKVRVQGWAEALQNPQVREQVLERWDHHLGMNEEFVQRAQQQGKMDPSLDEQAVSRVLQSLFDGLVLQWTIDPNIDVWKYHEAMMAMIAGLFGRNETSHDN
jgi:AcrR family transcriptional regulator